MRIVIAGGGIVGLALARHLRSRGLEPVVLEAMPAGVHVARGYMLGAQGYPSLAGIGVLEAVRAAGWEIAPTPDGSSVAIGVRVGRVIDILAEGVPVRHGVRVVDLVRGADGRVTGVVTDEAGARATLACDLVVAADGGSSPVRDLAGLRAHAHPLDSGMLTFLGTTPPERPFSMTPLSGGGFIGVFGWPEGAAGYLSTMPVTAEEALAPPLEDLKDMFRRLVPGSGPALEGLHGYDQVRYYRPALVTCPEWWRPGVVLAGDAAHQFGPETGVGSGLGLGDAQALAEAVVRNPGDPDGACRDYVRRREPGVRPYEAMYLQDTMPSATREPGHRWPPGGG